ncbi:aldehyde dehydrogenase family protein [Lonepinella koalarum]|uniref:Propionaldehyde dehydrogenase n=1 Tax=Lonepinella koalarum TaxID=53417 RepID=A0A4R1KR76_9PAST|nr:aldehyde dehydrogenase family protein [Lonepinella koalarum]MDH2926656.1 aldehyde dehydrogenase EutE [Lonepinella koalarum]TCK66980.1 propionaldehyde dehydrogenase [Lonepinella koalarum]TFJ88951.1 aldehyde dehydrogenase EutE [Lonepinella koalarum]
MNDVEISQAVSAVLSKYGVQPEQEKSTTNSVVTATVKETFPANLINQVVESCLAEKNVSASQLVTESKQNHVQSVKGIFSSMNDAVEAAWVAQRQYSLCSMKDRANFIAGIREVFQTETILAEISKLAVEETGMGCYEHKLIKNRVAATKSPGIEDLATQALSGDQGLTLIELSAYGVIGSITPTTNPTETIICNSIGMLAAGNSVVFSPHPRSRKVSLLAVKYINEKLAELGAPDNLVVTVDQPSIENTNALMVHPKVRMLVATGGPSIVRSVMSSGKKAIGAGAGNPPVVVDETADIEKAAKDIVNGCSFDNNLPCIAEKELIVVNTVADCLVRHMQNNGAYLLSEQTKIQLLQNVVLNDKKSGPNTGCVGKSAVYLLEKIGISAPNGTKIILVETDKKHSFVQHELMMPILPLIRVDNVDEAIDLAVEVEHGNRHTAIMHSTNVEKLTKMAKLIQTTIFVKNGPSYAGIGVGGEGFATFTIAGPTGEGLTSARSFARQRRCTMVESLNIR